MLVAASIAHLQGEKRSFQVVPTCPCQQLFSLESLLVTVRLSLVLVFGRHITLNRFQCGRNFRKVFHFHSLLATMMRDRQKHLLRPHWKQLIHCALLWSWQLVTCQHSRIGLPNQLMHLLPGHVSINRTLCSHWWLLQMLVWKLRKDYFRSRPLRSNVSGHHIATNLLQCGHSFIIPP